jgi:hypothetical protein
MRRWEGGYIRGRGARNQRRLNSPEMKTWKFSSERLRWLVLRIMLAVFSVPGQEVLNKAWTQSNREANS